MSAPPAPATRAIRRRGLLGWGIALVAVWLVVGLPAQFWLVRYAESHPGAFGATVLLLGAVLIIGLVCLGLGVRAERRAARTHRHDAVLAGALREGIAAVEARPAGEAYEPDVTSVVLEDARLVEVNEEADAELLTSARTTLTRRLLEFGAALSGAYQAGRAGWVDDPGAARASAIVGSLTAVRVEPIVRASLLEGAVSAVVEAPGPAGARDTYRIVIALSRGMHAWLQGLLDALAEEVGGERTHAGDAMLTGGRRLVERFAPDDTRYALDRLRALQRRPFAERDPIVVHGLAVGRNALLVTSLTLGRGGEPADLVPAAFPGMLGRAFATVLGALARDDA